ncbi:hypothetical protein FRC01_006512 [Tulasnella sp. 417]|nr:hypothetical protein FRC01_006512 [Tulasnella sp. 417]
MPCRSSSPSPQLRATATTTTTTTAKRQIWSTVSMSMHHRTSTTTTTAGTIHEGELEVTPAFSRDFKPETQAAGSSIPTSSFSTKTISSSSSGQPSSLLPPPYSATQQLPPHLSPKPSPKPEEQQTKSSSWRFEIALEGGSCVIKQLGPTMAPPAVVPREREGGGGANGVLACVKALFSIIAGTVMAVVGVIVSVAAVVVTYVFPSMAAKAPESVTRTPSQSSDHAIAAAPVNSRKRKLSPAAGSSDTSSPSIKDRRVLSPSDLSLVGSTSTGGGAGAAVSSTAPGIQRHVMFNLERPMSGNASVSSGGRNSNVDVVVGLNTPTVGTFSPDDDEDVSEMGVVAVARASTVSSSAPATSSGAGKKRKSWFMKRRSATLASAGAGSDVDDSSDAGTMASNNSAPPTPSTMVTELPPVSEEEAGSASDAKGKKEAKRGRGISLKLQFNSKSWKRRSGGSSATFVESASTGAEEEESAVAVGAGEATTPSSTTSSTSAPLPIQPLTSKQQKRRSFPFVGSSSTTTPSPLSAQQQPPSTAPIRPTARTNPYGAPYFAAPPTARLTSRSNERRRGSYDDAGTQSEKESAGGHRRAGSEDTSGKAFALPQPVRQDSTGSGFSRASSSLASGTTGSAESSLGLDGGVSEMGEFVPTATPASPPPAPAASKKTTSPYAKPRLPSTFPVSSLASSSVTSSASGRVASDSTVVAATALQAQKNDSRKRTSSASNRPPLADRHARMRDAALAWASDSEAASARVPGGRRGSASVVRESRLRE